MVGQIADGVDQSGVVPELFLPQFLDLQVMEVSGVSVGLGECRVYSTKNCVVRKYLFYNTQHRIDDDDDDDDDDPQFFLRKILPNLRVVLRNSAANRVLE